MRSKAVVFVLAVLLVLGAIQGVLVFGRGAVLASDGAEDGVQDEAQSEAQSGTQDQTVTAPMLRYGVYQGLGLTNEQLQKMQDLEIKYLEKTQNLRLSLQKLAIQLRTLWAKDPLDKEAIAQKAAEMARIQVDLTQQTREMHKEMQSILTPEQLKKLQQMPSAYGRMGRRGGHGGRGGRGWWGCMGPMGFGGTVPYTNAAPQGATYYGGSTSGPAI